MSNHLPQRVDVWNGDRTAHLGLGNYVGDVPVWFIVMPDGSLQSDRNAEEEPTPDMVPDGGRLMGPMMNPKIVLDSGRTVYGCQTWWGPAEEGAATEEVLDAEWVA